MFAWNRHRIATRFDNSSRAAVSSRLHISADWAMAVVIVLSALQFTAMSNFGKRVPGSAPANEPAASANTPVKESIPRMPCTRLIEAIEAGERE